MVKLNWVTHSDVGDQSMYVHDICMICESIVILCKSILSSDYFGSFCNSFATMFLPLFVSSIHRCKRIGEMGAQQLLLDTHGIKTLFLGLREMGDSATSTNTNPTRRDPYLKRVDEEIKKAESLLKLVSYPSDRLAQTFPVLWPEGTQDDLRALMALKGMKATEQNAVLNNAPLSSSSSSKNGTTKSLNPGKNKFFSNTFKTLESTKNLFSRR